MNGIKEKVLVEKKSTPTGQVYDFFVVEESKYTPKVKQGPIM